MFHPFQESLVQCHRCRGFDMPWTRFVHTFCIKVLLKFLEEARKSSAYITTKILNKINVVHGVDNLLISKEREVFHEKSLTKHPQTSLKIRCRWIGTICCCRWKNSHVSVSEEPVRGVSRPDEKRAETNGHRRVSFTWSSRPLLHHENITHSGCRAIGGGTPTYGKSLHHTIRMNTAQQH